VCKVHHITKQDRQYTYNVTLRRVRATIVVVENQYIYIYIYIYIYYIISVCVCRLRYPACKAHASYYTVSSVACLALLYFSTLSHKRHDFRNKMYIKCVFQFLYNFCLKYFSFQEEMNETLSKISSGFHVKYPLS